MNNEPTFMEVLVAAIKRDPEAMKRATQELMEKTDMTEQINRSLAEHRRNSGRKP